MKKKKKWTRFRHTVFTALIRPFVALIAKLKYHVSIEKFSQEDNRNWLVLSNHQTEFDQFFVGLAFKRPVYYVALEDLFSNGWVSKLIQWLVAPIPILKATSDVRAVMTCIRVAKEGGNIALFPEGNRTYSGRTCYIKPSVAALAKKLSLPIALFRIEGGYGVKPRWARQSRKGRMRAYVRKVIEPEEYQDLSKEALYDLICRELWVDESIADGSFQSKSGAENLEQVLYICPECGISEFESKGELLTCTHCGKQHRYTPEKRLEALEGETRFPYIAQWYDYQESFIRSLDLTPFQTNPMYRDTADVSEVIVFDRKRPLLKKSQVSIFGDRLEIVCNQDTMVLHYADIQAMACVVGHKLNVFYKGKIYQFKGDHSFNALKYCNIYYHAKFLKGEHHDGEFQFLGL